MQLVRNIRRLAWKSEVPTVQDIYMTAQIDLFIVGARVEICEKERETEMCALVHILPENVLSVGTWRQRIQVDA